MDWGWIDWGKVYECTWVAVKVLLFLALLWWRLSCGARTLSDLWKGEAPGPPPPRTPWRLAGALLAYALALLALLCAVALYGLGVFLAVSERGTGRWIGLVPAFCALLFAVLARSFQRMARENWRW